MSRLLARERWEKVEMVFAEAVLLDPQERERYITTTCGEDDELRFEVLSLLRHDTIHHTRNNRPLREALDADAASVVAPEPVVGRTIGPWRIERELGRGGMAVVYLGVRADGEFRQQVAVKLIRRGMDTPGVIERLRRERRILAALEHPYIARLLDGGTTPDGLPYIVMEYVEGVAIGRYCDEHGLGVDERCELVARVAQAVAFAHRSLVIHRDLKPANILVDAQGNPKLLDFGIGKVLTSDEDDSESALTRGPARLLTPEYASPEQIQSRVAGTATDIYSLGVVLHELLTGERPSQPDRKASLAATRNGKNRKWQRAIEGDLDNILQMALREEPERRYLSMERFERDLRLHLSGKPVEARGESVVYRCGKFLHRHRVGALTAALVALSVIAGTASTLWQARQAQARQVEAERQRAASQKRLEDLLGLVKTSLFDVQDTLERMPGAMDARRELITTTVRYLEGLSTEAKDDPGLLRLLGSGWTEVGDVLGLPERANLGDRAGALSAWAKARVALTRLEQFEPRNTNARLQDLGLHQRVGLVDESVGDWPGAIGEYRAGLKLAAAVAAENPQDAKIRSQPGILEHYLGSALLKSKDPSAKRHMQEEIRIYESVTKQDPENAELQRGLGSAYTNLAQAYMSDGRPEAALAEFRKSYAVREKLAARFPNDVLTLRGVAGGHERIALALGATWQPSLNDRKAAVAEIEQAIPIREKILKADPADRKAKFDLATCLVWAGGLDPDAHTAMTRLKRALTLVGELRAADPKNVTYANTFAQAQKFFSQR